MKISRQTTYAIAASVFLIAMISASSFALAETQDFALLAQSNAISALQSIPSGTYTTKAGHTTVTEVLEVMSPSSNKVVLDSRLSLNGTFTSETILSYSLTSSGISAVISGSSPSAKDWTVNTMVPTNMLTPAGTIFTDTISNHAEASEAATATPSDWAWSCGLLGCAISFNKGEGDLISYLLDAFGTGYGVVIAILAIIGIEAGLAVTVAGIIIAIGTFVIATLDYVCGSKGYWLGLYILGFAYGCNPVPWYL
jgi:hypothetical protein